MAHFAKRVHNMTGDVIFSRMWKNRPENSFKKSFEPSKMISGGGGCVDFWKAFRRSGDLGDSRSEDSRPLTCTGLSPVVEVCWCSARSKYNLLGT